MRFGLSSYYCGLFGLYDIERSKYWILFIFDTKWSQRCNKINIFPLFDSLAFKMTFTAFVGLFQYFMGFLVSFKATSARKCQIFAKAIFLEFWNKSSLKLPVCGWSPFLNGKCCNFIYYWRQLTTSLRMLSGMFLEELQTVFAEEWENITGASLTASVSRAVWIELQ